MRHKLVIVDDEQTIRDGLKNYVDWMSLNFEVAASFEDGKEVIEYVKTNRVDVVLTDIKMVDVSGIELAEYLSINNPDIKVVLISGFKEFEFAKQAISFGVVDYILKPIRVMEITRVFEDISKCLILERQQTEVQHQKEKQIDEIYGLLNEQFFRDLIIGALIDREEIEKKIKLLNFGIDIDQRPVSLIEVKLENYHEYIKNSWEYGKDRLDESLRTILGGESECAEFHTLATAPGSFKIVAIRNCRTSIQSLDAYVRDYMKNLKDNIANVFTLKLEIVSIECFSDIYALSKSSEAIPISRNGTTIDDSDIELMLNDAIIIEQQKIFKTSILSGDESAVFSLLNNMIDKLKLFPNSFIHNFIINLFMDLFSSLSTIDISIQKVRQEKFDYSNLIRTVDIDEIKLWAKEMSGIIMEQISPDTETSNKLFVRKALIYIKERFNQDLSLDEVASHVYLNPAYFCRLFKQETGENFINYLIKIRMTKAIEIMRSSNHRISEIGIMVGYKNSKYFSKVFKSYTGSTPSSYQKKIIKDELSLNGY